MKALLEKTAKRRSGQNAGSLPERFEVVNGEIVEVEPMSVYSNEVANRLYFKLVAYSEQTGLGRPRMETKFIIPLPEDTSRNRIPDLTFIANDRWAVDRPLPLTGDQCDIVPDLAVEVVSPNDEMEPVIAKALEYLRGGVRTVWVILPLLKQIYVYKPGKSIEIFDSTDMLQSPDVLPGFCIPVASLFPPVANS